MQFTCVYVCVKNTSTVDVQRTVGFTYVTSFSIGLLFTSKAHWLRGLLTGVVTHTHPWSFIFVRTLCIYNVFPSPEPSPEPCPKPSSNPNKWLQIDVVCLCLHVCVCVLNSGLGNNWWWCVYLCLFVSICVYVWVTVIMGCQGKRQICVLVPSPLMEEDTETNTAGETSAQGDLWLKIPGESVGSK